MPSAYTKIFEAKQPMHSSPDKIYPGQKLEPGSKETTSANMSDETAEKTSHPRIFVGKTPPQDWQVVSRRVQELGEMAGADAAGIRSKFKAIVPEYQGEATQDTPVDRVWAHPPHKTFSGPSSSAGITPLQG